MVNIASAAVVIRVRTLGITSPIPLLCQTCIAKEQSKNTWIRSSEESSQVTQFVGQCTPLT